jgi:hypothetical protein
VARDIRERCRALVDTLDIPEPFDLGEFCHRLERRRGRPILMVAITAVHGTPCGMWVSTARADYIFHERSTSPLHRQHIIMHEIGHMLFDHRPGTGPSELLLPDLDPELVDRMLGRTAYDCEQELEAETFADLMSLIINAREPTSCAPPEQAEIVSRIERTFGRRRRS